MEQQHGEREGEKKERKNGKTGRRERHAGAREGERHAPRKRGGEEGPRDGRRRKERERGKAEEERNEEEGVVRARRKGRARLERHEGTLHEGSGRERLGEEEEEEEKVARGAAKSPNETKRVDCAAFCGERTVGEGCAPKGEGEGGRGETAEAGKEYDMRMRASEDERAHRNLANRIGVGKSALV